MSSGPRPSIGVAVGKFNPPHLGHLHLVRAGAAAVDRMYVLLCDRPGQSIPAADRQRWLIDCLPGNVTVLITPDDLPEANGPWAARALEVLPGPPTLAVTSEPWGEGWAALMGAHHLLVDLDRTTHPVSGTALRRDLAAHFASLVPAARADLARRVVVIGAESTGKTTMAQALARELATVWVPEHGRWYWEGRRHLGDQSWDTEEFRRIAAAQTSLTDDLARRSPDGLVIADTDALVTAAWHRRYLGRADPVLESTLIARAPDLYLACQPDFPWVQDGTRESRGEQRDMQRSMEDLASRTGTQVVPLSGPPEQRLAQALEALAPLRTFPVLD